MFRQMLFLYTAVVVTHSTIVKIKERTDNFILTTGNSSEKDWWQAATIYQIYPRSFKDSNNDGNGDIQGIIEKLDYIKSLGVTAIWLSPIFKSPQADQGYDISDFRDIDPLYGTLEEFVNLINEAHNRSLKIILDFVPNHTSDQHEWFQKSVNRIPGYEDYYIWENAAMVNNTRQPPNNWISVFKYSAWEWNEIRQQYYFHQFLKEQPDLNYRNDKVKQEIKDILTFWLDTHNVDGLRIDAIPHLFEAKNLTDEPLSHNEGETEIDYNYLNHIYTTNQPETFDIVYEWREFLDNITEKKNGTTRIFMTEAATSIVNVIKYYGSEDGSKLGAHFSFNFFLLGLSKDSNAEYVKVLIETWFNILPSRFKFNWLLGNHDNHRIASKVGVEKIDGLNMLTAFLPGIQVTYNGEEIGMENGNVTCKEGQDGSATKDNCTHYESSSRDYERTPFQWDTSVNAGFNDGNSTWLPVSSKYKECNVADEEEDDKSHLSIYKNLQKIRTNLTDQDTVKVFLLGEDKSVLHITRYLNTSNVVSDVYDYVFNIGNKSVTNLNFNETRNDSILEVAVASKNSSRNVGDTFSSVGVTLEPYECLILTNTITSGQPNLISSYLYLIVSIFMCLIFNYKLLSVEH